MMILAASTQRTIGLTLAVLVALAFAVYVIVNVFFTGRDEVGSEIELAPNRKPYFDDNELETKKLDWSLAAGVAGLVVIAVALPLYWLGEPGRQEGRVDETDELFVLRGENQYTALCAQCHGSGGVGGVAAYTVVDDDGRFVASAQWKAPALNNVLYRYSVEEVTWVLNYGRPQSPMPAWGLPGGGPLTTQQLEEIIDYLASIQLTEEDMQGEISVSLRAAVLPQAIEESPAIAELDAAFTEASGADEPDPTAIAAAQEELTVALDAFIADLSPEEHGEYLFNLSAGQGAYNCARCHTAGNSWGADELLAQRPDLAGLIPAEVPGGGGYGPSLLNVESQFNTAAQQAAFITIGCEEGARYGNNGMCDGGGQMPGYGETATDLPGAMLLPEQIDAIVAYERESSPVIALIHTLAGIGWEPTIRGYLTVALGSAVLMGSVWLLLATNLGHRLASLVAAAGFFGWMAIMGIIWWIYGIGYLGEAQSWQIVELITAEEELPNAATGDVADLARSTEATPREVVDTFCPGLVEAVEDAEAARVLEGDISIETDIPAGLPDYCNDELGVLLAVDSEVVRAELVAANDALAEDDPRRLSPEELDARIADAVDEEIRKKEAVTLSALDAVSAEIINEAKAAEVLDFVGWQLTSTADAGEAQASASAWLVENSTTSGFQTPGDFVFLNAYNEGGRELLVQDGEPRPSTWDRAWHEITQTVQILNPTEYSVVEVQRALQKEGRPGEAPPFPEPDDNYSTQYVVMVRDMGDVRLPSALVTLGSTAIFAGLCLMLHRRDLLWRARQEGKA